MLRFTVSQSHDHGGATRRGVWMGEEHKPRHAKKLMHETKQRNAGRKGGSETEMRLSSVVTFCHFRPFQVPSSQPNAARFAEC